MNSVFDPAEENPLAKYQKTILPQGKRVKDMKFGFDRVFDENCSQQDVYECTTKPLLDSVLDGFNATVFAYGATGCGKTHTIRYALQRESTAGECKLTSDVSVEHRSNLVSSSSPAPNCSSGYGTFKTIRTLTSLYPTSKSTMRLSEISSSPAEVSSA